MKTSLAMFLAVSILAACGKEDRPGRFLPQFLSDGTGPKGFCPVKTKFLNMPECRFRGDYCIQRGDGATVLVGLHKVSPGECGYEVLLKLTSD